MLKFGVVTHVDPATARVRVRFEDQDDTLSYWLPVLKPKTLQDKFYCLPDINEHVACLMDEHFEAGVVLGAIYSDADAPPVTNKDKTHIKFSDGTVIEYDRTTHKLTADIKGSAEIKATGNISITGDVVVTGNITATGNVADQGGAKTMAGMRSTFNTHTHNETGTVTSAPSQAM